MSDQLRNPVAACSGRRLSGSALWKSPAWNLFLVTKGSLTVRAGDRSYEETLLALRTGEELRLASEEGCEFDLLEFDPSALLSLPRGRDLLGSVITGTQLAETERIRITDLTARFRESVRESPDRPLAACAYALMILDILSAHAASADPFAEETAQLPERRQALVRPILAYMAEHGDEELSQAGTAARFGITPQYLGRLLKEAAGATFRECLGRIRDETAAVRAASEVLRTAPPDLPGEALPEETSGGEDRGAAARAGVPGEGGGFHEIHVNLAPKNELRRHWRKLINLGYAVNLRNLEIDATLAKVQREAGFEYGRICRITDLIAVGRVGNRTFHDYSPVFALLDRLMAAGITPFLELGNKAFLIQETTEINYNPLSPVDTRKYFSELLQILPGFLRACVNHYGQENFDRWYFEISYMYTDSQEKESFGLLQYVRTFRRIRSIIRGFSDRCRVGGPGFNDWSSKEKVTQAVRLLASDDAQPDFFSAYIYPMEIEDGTVFLPEDPDTAKMRASLFADTVLRYCPGTEIWITEFNSNLSSRNFLNDSCFQAAFLAKMVLDTYSLPITAIGYYLLSDAPLRYLDSLDFMFGGWGLFTDAGIPKASWQTYRMLSNLGHYIVLETDRCLVTANSRGSVRILLCRYCHPAGKYRRSNVERDDLSVPEAVFTDLGSDRYSVRIDNILKGVYILKEYRVNRRSGNLIAKWKEYGYLYPGDTATAAELSAASELIPVPRIHLQKQDRPFETEVVLTGSEVCLISLELYTSRT